MITTILQKGYFGISERFILLDIFMITDENVETYFNSFHPLKA